MGNTAGQTTVAHPITGDPYPLLIDATAAARSLGMTRAAVVKLAQAGEIDTAPHARLDRWEIYTLPLWRRFGLIAEATS